MKKESQPIKSKNKKLVRRTNLQGVSCTDLKNDLNKRVYIRKSFRNRMSIKLSGAIGSWVFIFLQATLIVVWVTISLNFSKNGWDSPSFLILNLILSVVAAFSAPIILMSQNVEADRDRIRSISDLTTDRRAEKRIQDIQRYIRRIDRRLAKLSKK